MATATTNIGRRRQGQSRRRCGRLCRIMIAPKGECEAGSSGANESKQQQRWRRAHTNRPAAAAQSPFGHSRRPQTPSHGLAEGTRPGRLGHAQGAADCGWRGAESARVALAVRRGRRCLPPLEASAGARPRPAARAGSLCAAGARTATGAPEPTRPLDELRCRRPIRRQISPRPTRRPALGPLGGRYAPTGAGIIIDPHNNRQTHCSDANSG